MKTTIVYNRYKVSGEAPVHLYIYFSRSERLYVHTGVKIEENFWDAKNLKVKKSHPKHITLNYKITQLIERLQGWETDAYRRGEPVTSERVKAYLEGRDKGMSIVQLLREMLRVESRRIGPETLRQRESVIRNMEKFEPGTLGDINQAWLLRYHDHLLTTMKASSTGKNHKMVKRAIARAITQGLISQNPYTSFRIPEAGKRIIFLTSDELKSLRAYQGVARLEKVRDLFLFQCLTGMSYGDMQQLLTADIQQRGNRYFIAKARVKTGTMQLIPLFDEARHIIERYADDVYAFPRISNQKINAYLLEIETVCALGKHLTTHVARHTYATLMLTKGLPLETVSHILGHTSTCITQVYAKVVIEKIEEDLNRLGIEGV